MACSTASFILVSISAIATMLSNVSVYSEMTTIRHELLLCNVFSRMRALHCRIRKETLFPKSCESGNTAYRKKNVRARKIQKQVFIITVAKLSPSSQVAGKIDFVVNTYNDKKQLQICDSKSGQPFPYMFPTRDITV